MAQADRRADDERRSRERSGSGRRPGGDREDGQQAGTDEERSLDQRRAEHARRSPGRETVGPSARAAEGVLVQVCERCGQAYMFDDEEPPAGLTCEKCGNGVFRSFFEVTGHDDVDEDFRSSTERDVAMNDDESDITRADIIDLNNP